jgi:hypothetical protein
MFCVILLLVFAYCKITYFQWDFISRFCHIVSLQQSKIHIFGRVVIENPLNIFILAGFIFAIMTPTRNRENKTHAKISDFTVVTLEIGSKTPVLLYSTSA